MREITAARRAAQTASAAIVIAAMSHAAPAHAQNNPVVIEGVDGDTRDAIRRVLPERAAPETVFDAERIAEEAAERAESWLRAEGWYGGTAQPIAEDDPPRARLKINLGPRFVFVAPTITFDVSPPDETTQNQAKLAIGQVAVGAPARAIDVLGAEAAALATLQNSGYPDAKAGERRAVVDHATGEMAVEFRFASGDPAKLGKVVLDPPGVVKQSFVEKLATWDEGDRYAPDKLVALRRDLSATGVFSRATTRLSETPNEKGERDVIVRLEAAKKRSIELGASYSTTEGVGVNGEWTRRNIYGRADALTLSATLAELEQSVGAQLLRPHDAGRGRARRYGIELAHEDNTAYKRTGLTISTSVEAEPNLRFAATYGASIAANLYDESEGVDNALIVSAFGDLKLDHADRELDPRHGYIAQGRVEPSVSTGDATTAFVRFTASTSGYWSRKNSDRLTLAARIGTGWIQPVTGDEEDLPLDRRFYAGGGGSVRGYEYRSIYPQSDVVTDEAPGGQGLLETSVEARFRFGPKWGAAAFLDGGNAFDQWGDAADLKWGVGAGVRYDLGFAPLRFDIAVPLDKREGDPGFAFYVSLGQAF